MAFRVLIIGGTGQVGAAVVRALAAERSCAEVVMVNRRAISLAASPRVRQVTMDTAAEHFTADVTTLAHGMVAQRDPVYGASCVGVGKGSLNWSEEELKAALKNAGQLFRRLQAEMDESGIHTYPPGPWHAGLEPFPDS